MLVKQIRNKKIDFALLAILLLALILRVYNVDFQSIWLDEIHTMIETSPSLSFSEYVDLMYKREQMPHLYFIIVKCFIAFFGSSVFLVRLISALIGVVSIYAIYLLGKELVSRKTGYIAALFLTVNQFHIFYSQEARPYILLSLFTILSFLFLVKFIKSLSRKDGLYFALIAALMINTHFFGLFVLASQVLVLLILLITIEKKDRKPFFINALISGLLILILFIPSISVFLKVSQLKSFWIQPPSSKFFAELFNRFFSGSEFLMYSSILLIIAFFVKLFSQKTVKRFQDNKYVLSFVILIVWLFTIFMIPYIRTYTNVPMMLNRYFMSALPAIILLISIGLSSLRASVVTVLFAIIFVFSSFTDLFLVKDYYQRINKTQYREITEEVKAKNINDNLIVSPWSWHLGYFFDKKELLSPGTLNEYINNLRVNKQNIESFWYLDAHFHDYDVTPVNETFLKNNFHLVDEIKYFDTWANFYLAKDASKNFIIDLNKFKPNLVQNGAIVLQSNTSVLLEDVFLIKGNYRLILKTISKPNPPINEENSHLDVSVNDKRLGGFYTSSKNVETTVFDFNIDNDSTPKIALTFANDFFALEGDRDLIIYGVSIEKLN